MRKTIARGSEVTTGTGVEDRLAEEVSPAASPSTLDHEVARQRGGRLILAVIAAAVIVVAAVVVMQTVGDETSAPPTIEEPPDVVPPALTEEQRIIAAYRKYDEVDFAAQQTGNPDHPLYSAYLTGPQLQAARDGVRRLRDQGLVMAPPTVNELTVTVESIEGDRAKIRACGVDDAYPVRADTGEPIAPRRLGTALIVGDMVQEHGAWKASYLTRVQQWEGRAGCALE
ncbi:MAG TPA: hypothetical protein VFJ85_01220 [Acidimicrobiales bacterium]|nr:hypothetical protein [Acidimicrobiales bacterium]